MKEPLDFWYESNACWGRIKSIENLIEKLKYQLEENNCIYNVDDFLNKSCQSEYDPNDFGTRIEHSGLKTLRHYLSEKGYLEEFLIEANKLK